VWLKGTGFWWDNLDIQILSYDQHYFSAEIKDNGVPEWSSVRLYGCPKMEYMTWELIRNIKDRTPLIFVDFCDFNEILYGIQNGLGKPRHERKRKQFKR